VGLEEEAVLYLLQIASSEHQIRSAFTCSSLRGYIYVEAILDANLISLLKLTPGIIRKSSGIVSQMIEPSDWLKLLTMKNPKTAVEARQWIRVRKGAYKGDSGFVTDVEVWGARVLVVPRLKTPTLEAAGSLKRKRTGFKPEPSLFDPIMFSSVFNCQPKVLGDGIYSSRGLIFEHQLQCISLDFDSMSLNFTGVPSKILALFKLSAHPSLTGSEFPRPEEWIFEEGERVTVCSSGKTATITAVELTHLLVDLATDEGIQAVSWYNVRKVFSTRDFVSVTSGALKGTMGWFLEIVDDIVTFQEYEEKGNLNQDPKVSFILTPADVY
jgi:Early transcription elongation factor of RNA pol II, NGN section